MTMQSQNRQKLRPRDERLVGRIFTRDKKLHYIVDVEHHTGFAVVTCRNDSRTRTLKMPICEASLRVAGFLH